MWQRSVQISLYNCVLKGTYKYDLVALNFNDNCLPDRNLFTLCLPHCEQSKLECGRNMNALSDEAFKSLSVYMTVF